MKDRKTLLVILLAAVLCFVAAGVGKGKVRALDRHCLYIDRANIDVELIEKGCAKEYEEK